MKSQTINAPKGTLCTLFMYQVGVGDRADEIDIEIISGSREIWFTTWIAGKRVNHASRTLRFDPSSGFHTYTIQRAASEIRFLVNGELLHSFRHANAKKLPQAAMPLLCQRGANHPAPSSVSLPGLWFVIPRGWKHGEEAMDDDVACNDGGDDAGRRRGVGPAGRRGVAAAVSS